MLSLCLLENLLITKWQSIDFTAQQLATGQQQPKKRERYSTNERVSWEIFITLLFIALNYSLIWLLVWFDSSQQQQFN